MTPLQRMRHAVALAHTVPGVELRMHTPHGEQVVVSRHPAADVDPCVMRQIVLASIRPGNPDVASRVVSIDVGGALVEVGGGVLGGLANGRQQRWITSLLRPERVAELLEGVGLDVVPEDAMSATLKPDAELGVTALVITSNDERWDHALDAVAAEAASTCFVEELQQDVSTDAFPQGHVSGGRS